MYYISSSMKHFFLIFSFLFVLSFDINAQVITEVAGCGTGCPVGDGGPATAANITNGGQPLFDTYGNMYIGVFGQARIRKVDALTGIITTIAGTGVGGYTGDGGPATSARIAGSGFGIDASNNIYFSDNSKGVIRKVEASSGKIFTIAGVSSAYGHYSGDGGPATNASFKMIYNIAVDPAGNIYTADSDYIRKIDATTGTIDKYAGTGLRGFSGDGGSALSAKIHANGSSQGMCTDVYGNFYFCDSNCVRKVSTSGIITRLAGDYTTLYGGDGVPATSIGVLCYTVAVDPSGNLFISEEGQQRIRMVDVSGIIHTVAGNGTPGFSGDGGPATAAQLNRPQTLCVGRCDNNLYLGELINQRIRKVDFTSLPMTCICTLAVAVNVVPNDTVCSGTSVTYTANVMYGGSSNTFKWYVNGSIVSTVGNTYTYTPSNIDSIRCVVTSSGGTCGSPVTASSNTINMVVNVAGPITGPSLVCIGQSITLSVPGSGGTWGSSNTGVASVSGGTVTGASGGTATISYTSSGCTATTSVTVSPGPSAITGNPKLCIGTATALSSTTSGGTWSSSNSSVATVSSGTVNGIAAGTAAISYAIGGCYVIQAVTVSAAPPSITGPSSLCIGSTAALSNSVAGGTWSSSSPSVATVSSGLVSGVSAGTAVITYDVSGCNVVKTVSVIAIPAPAPITGPSLVCVGTAAVFSDATPGGIWSSSSPSVATVTSGGSVSGITAGTSTISYTMSNMCGTVAATVVVSVVSSPTVGPITGPSEVCAGSAITLTDATLGGTWTSSNAGKATVSSGMVSGISAGTAVITYKLTLSCGTAFDTRIITVYPTPPAIAGHSVVCAADTIILGNALAGGTWSSSAPSVATIASDGTVTGVSGGTADITYTTTGGCYTTRIVSVSPLPNAGSVSGQSVICIGGSANLTDNIAGGTWSVSGSAVSISLGIVSAVSVGTATVSYEIANSCGSAWATKVIEVVAPPDSGVISGMNVSCVGASFTLLETVSGGNWSSSNSSVAGINASGTVNVKTSGTTIITYTTIPNAGGCTSSAYYTLTILASAPYTINAITSNAMCYGKADGHISTSISNGSGSYTYTWSNGASIAVLDNIAAGSYSLQVTDAATLCRKDTSFVITQPDSLNVVAQTTPDLCKASNGAISITTSGGRSPYRYAWSNGASSAAVADLTANTYTVHVYDANNCEKYYSAIVTDSCDDITIPDVITPNGDGFNDSWIITGLGKYPRNTARIFDKWGDMVYEANGYMNNWKGDKMNGDPLPSGTYYYLIKLGAPNATGGKDVFTGSILIKR